MTWREKKCSVLPVYTSSVTPNTGFEERSPGLQSKQEYVIIPLLLSDIGVFPEAESSDNIH